MWYIVLTSDVIMLGIWGYIPPDVFFGEKKTKKAIYLIL